MASLPQAADISKGENVVAGLDQDGTVTEQVVSVPDLQDEYDFVEKPSRDFYCPVTFKLLTDPQQTTCCGNHLSQEAAKTPDGESKPCPICNDPQLCSMPDKFFKRKVNELKVHCPHKKSACEWVGKLNEVEKHSDLCPKRPWQCEYCPFSSTYDSKDEHVLQCPLQPVPCEYAEFGCDVKVPRKDLARHMEEGQKQHLLSAHHLNVRLAQENKEEKAKRVSAIQEKALENENLRKQLSDKVQLEAKIIEIQQQIEQRHVEVNRTLANQLRMINEKELEYKTALAMKDQCIKERDEKIEETDVNYKKQLKQVQDELRQKNEDKTQQVKEQHERELAMKDKLITDQDADFKKRLKQLQEEKAQQLNKIDKEIATLKEQLKQTQDMLKAQVISLEQQVTKLGSDIQDQLKKQEKRVEHLQLRQLQGFTLHEFTLTEISKWQTKSVTGDCLSEPFYSHPLRGYKFQLRVLTNGTLKEDAQKYLSVQLDLLECGYDEELEWPFATTVHIQLLNQLGDHGHYEKTAEEEWSEGKRNHHGAMIERYIEYSDLELNADKSVQYLKNDSLVLRVYIKIKPAKKQKPVNQ